MRILITSGGTKVPIDPVRNITNTSTGKFGADIARAALIAKSEVIYLTSAEGRSPFAESFDFYLSDALEQYSLKLNMLSDFFKQYGKQYSEYRYNNYAEYSMLLKKIVEDKQPDVVILAAAVSDYVVENYSVQKIRSSENLQLKLKHAPKLIHQIKKWLPNAFLVGFKLLLDAPDDELVEAARQSIYLNHADLIIANNLATLQQGVHQILLVERDGTFKKITKNLADEIIKRIMQRLP